MDQPQKVDLVLTVLAGGTAHLPEHIYFTKPQNSAPSYTKLGC